MGRGVIACVGMSIVLVLVIVAFIVPWYSAGYPGGPSNEYCLTRKVSSFFDHSYSMSYEELQQKSYWESHLVSVCDTTLYLVLAALNTTILSLIGIVGVLLHGEKTRVFRGIAVFFGVLTGIFLLGACLYFMVSWESSIVVEGTQLSGSVYGFWFQSEAESSTFSGSPGFAWYSMILLSLIAWFSSLVCLKQSSRVKNVNMMDECSSEFNRFVGCWRMGTEDDPLCIRFFDDGVCSAYGERNQRVTHASWVVNNGKVSVFFTEGKGTIFEYGFSDSDATLTLVHEETKQAMVLKKQDFTNVHQVESCSMVLPHDVSVLYFFTKKKIVKIGAILLVLLFLLPSSSFIIIGVSQKSSDSESFTVTDNPFLWQIGDENPSYVYGSYHINDERILTLPDCVVNAIDEVDVVMTEVVFTAENHNETVQCSSLSNEQTILDVLSPELYWRVLSYLYSIGYEVYPFEQYKIWQLAYWGLPDTAYLLTYSSKPYLDNYIQKLARARGKESAGLETIDEHMTILDSLSLDEQTRMLENTLDYLEYMEKYPDLGVYSRDAAIQVYLDGELTVYENSQPNPLDVDYDLEKKIYTLVITERNHRMAERINELITKNPDTQYFFVVGVAHMSGDDGILSLLEEDGHTVYRVPFTDSPVCSPSFIQINDRCYYPYE
ncbi:MAG: TraB/GumN family protein [Methanobacteriota archaeon]